MPATSPNCLTSASASAVLLAGRVELMGTSSISPLVCKRKPRGEPWDDSTSDRGSQAWPIQNFLDAADYDGRWRDVVIQPSFSPFCASRRGRSQPGSPVPAAA